MTVDRLALARRAATTGGESAADLFRTDLEVGTKSGKTDYVTRADRRAQTRVIEVIREVDPDAAIVAEEGDRRKTVPPDGPAWIIDPIDGTNNYVRGIRQWVTSVAAVVDGEAVAAANAAPALNDLYAGGPEQIERNDERVSVSERTDPERCTITPTIWWEQDRRDEYAAAASAIVRRFGDLYRPKSAQLALSLIAAGSIEGAFTNRRVNPWDSIAGAFLVRQAGGTVTDIDGNPWRYDSRGLVASNGAVHDAVLAAAQTVESVRSDGR
ncbi:MAG: inositol monophosphatase family protein [Halodesulfurarchaeum sp.]